MPCISLVPTLILINLLSTPLSQLTVAFPQLLVCLSPPGNNLSERMHSTSRVKSAHGIYVRYCWTFAHYFLLSRNRTIEEVFLLHMCTTAIPNSTAPPWLQHLWGLPHWTPQKLHTVLPWDIRFMIGSVRSNRNRSRAVIEERLNSHRDSSKINRSLMNSMWL